MHALETLENVTAMRISRERPKMSTSQKVNQSDSQQKSRWHIHSRMTWGGVGVGPQPVVEWLGPHHSLAERKEIGVVNSICGERVSR